jgi:beta-lactamase class A
VTPPLAPILQCGRRLSRQTQGAGRPLTHDGRMPSRKEKERRDEEHPLRAKVRAIAEKGGARSVAVAYYDYETETAWSYRGDEWFHAASTIKVPVLLGVFRAIDQDRLSLLARVHVRNRFISAAGDRSAYRVASARDANAEVQKHIGKTMRVQELAHHMITTSSNLATNLLIEIVGVDAIVETLRELKLDRGVTFRRGVEDDAAHEAGINNLCTADGMLAVLRAIEERRGLSDRSSEQMLEILHAQEFRSGIPARLPEGVRVANKTGEISTVAHDAGIVYVPGRKPYAVVVLTEWEASKTSGRSDTIARISRAVFDHLTGGAA